MFGKLIKNRALAGLLLATAVVSAHADLQVPGNITLQLYNQTSRDLILTPVYNINNCVEKNFVTPIKLPANTIENLQGYVAPCQNFNAMFAIAFKVKPVPRDDEIGEVPGGNFAFICGQNGKCSFSRSEFPFTITSGATINLSNPTPGKRINEYMFNFVER